MPGVRDLARALFQLSNTGGPVKSAATAKGYLSAIRHMARRLDPLSVPRGVLDLTGAMLFDYWRECCPDYEARIRRLLVQIDKHAPGLLRPATVTQLRGIPLNQPHSRPRERLSAGETDRLLAICRRVVDETEARMADADALVARGADPCGGRWREEANLAWLLEREGPHDLASVAARLGVGRSRLQKALRGKLVALHGAVFPTYDAVLAFRVLVGLETGIPPEGVDTLRAGCLEWMSDTDARITWCKARGGGLQSHTFPSRGRWSAGRLVERWLRLSERARRFAPDPGSLWLICDLGTLTIHTPRFWFASRDAWVARHGVLAEDGSPLRLRFSALRATYFVRHDRAWNGALRIDPNHSRRVEGDSYLSQTRSTDAIEATIEAAQRDCLRKADAAALTVLTTEELADLVGDPTRAPQRLDLSAEHAAELLAGERDVFAAACKGFHNSPYGRPGSPCPAAVWTCLFCPLAVFTPSKLPNLLRLRDHLDRQWKALRREEWMHLYGAAHVRLERDILPQFRPAEVEAARAGIEEDVNGEAQIYLPPEETAWS
ncbi:MAG: hypothetical protein ACRDKW_16275 [Actinomycetota bacterium]